MSRLSQFFSLCGLGFSHLGSSLPVCKEKFLYIAGLSEAELLSQAESAGYKELSYNCLAQG